MGAILVISVICLFLAIYGFRAGSKLENTRERCNNAIQKFYAKIFSRTDGTVEQQLYKILEFVFEKQQVASKAFQKDNEINVTAETCSNLGLCGVSKTQFFSQMQEFSPLGFELLSDCNETFRNYALAVSDITLENRTSIKWRDAVAKADELAPEVELLLAFMEEEIESEFVVDAECLDLSRIKYYKIEGTEHYVSDVSGGGVNVKGAVAGAILGGGAAAIIGSHIGTETQTEIRKMDNRKITIFYDDNGRVGTIEVISENFDTTISALRKLIPEKEESIVQVNAQIAQQPTMPISTADEIMKYKVLLDSGVISQEEFDIKRKQLLDL